MRHLESGEVAGYLDGALAPADRSRLEAHAVECEACRAELIEAAGLLGTVPSRRRWYVPAGAVAAAAAAVVLLLVSRPPENRAGAAGYREPAITVSPAPVVVAPRTTADTARQFVWTSVPRADRYRLTLFDGTGTVVWEEETTDTTAMVPGGIRLQPGALYLWKVEAQVGWNRWVSSDLVEFSPGAAPR